mgnify:CR=1 FL=1
MAHGSATGIEIELGFFPLAFFLFACTPRVDIDGTTHMQSWGTHVFAVAAGRHTVRVWFHYLFMSRCGENQIDVEVREGETLRLKYWMPPWMLAKGSLKRA